MFVLSNNVRNIHKNIIYNCPFLSQTMQKYTLKYNSCTSFLKNKVPQKNNNCVF